VENKITFILGFVISTFIVMFAEAGGIYLIGNIMIGWSWLTFDICFEITGVMVLIAFMIVIYTFDRKEECLWKK